MGRKRKAAAAPASAPEPVPAPEPAVPVQAPEQPPAPGDPVRDAVAAILDHPKQRSALPTFVTYPTGESVLRRHVIVDVSDGDLRAAWQTYCRMVPDGTAERFLLIVYGVTRCEIPRMYRAVGTVDLCQR